MINKILEVIKSCKEYQFSKALRETRQKLMMIILNHSEANQQPALKIKEGSKSAIFSDYIDPYLNQIQFSPKLVSYFSSYQFVDGGKQGEAVPFAQFDHEPKPVSQLKKIVNALYYGELAFKKLESCNLYTITGHHHILINFFKVIWPAWNTINPAYEAMRLATKLDVELQDLLKPQLTALETMFLTCKATWQELDSENRVGDFKDKLFESNVDIGQSLFLGQCLGDAISKCEPNTATDYSWLSSYSSQLPAHINHLRQEIEELGKKAIGLSPALSDKRVQALQLNTNKLITAIQSAQTRALYNPFNIPNIIRLVYQLMGLIKQVVSEFGELNESTQLKIKKLLSDIKYVVIPQILGQVDSLEVSLMLEPGLISASLLKPLNSKYDALVRQLSGVVDFESEPNGLEVCSLIDNKFIKERLRFGGTRGELCIKQGLINEHRKKSWVKFKRLIEKHQQTSIDRLSVETKLLLKTYYLSFQDCVVKLDPDLDDAFVSLINKENFKGIRTSPSNYTSWLGYTRVSSKLLELDSPLEVLFNKQETTLAFYLGLQESANREVIKQSDELANKSHTLHADSVDKKTLMVVDGRAFDNVNSSEYYSDYIVAIKGEQKQRAQTKLKPGTEMKRRHHLLKTKVASESIAKARNNLKSYLANEGGVLHEAVVAVLKPSDEGMPYPMLLEDNPQAFSPSKVIAIQKISNALYSIEELLKNAEKLSDNSCQIPYVFKMGLSLYHGITAAKQLYSASHDSYLLEIHKELMAAYEKICENIPSLPKIYIPPNEKNASEHSKNIEIALNIFFTLPTKIRAFDGKVLSDNERDALSENATIMRRRIDAIVKSNSAWFRLALKVPEMLSIASKLRQQVSELTDTSFSVTVENLEKLKTEGFSEILELADNAELKLGLKTGLLSTTLHDILKQFYQGLVLSLPIDRHKQSQLLLDCEYLGKRTVVQQEKLAEVEQKLTSLKERQALSKELSKLVDESQINRYRFSILSEQISQVHRNNKIRLGNVLASMNILSAGAVSQQSTAEKDQESRLEKLLEQFRPELVQLNNEYQDVPIEYEQLHREGNKGRLSKIVKKLDFQLSRQIVSLELSEKLLKGNASYLRQQRLEEIGSENVMRTHYRLAVNEALENDRRLSHLRSDYIAFIREYFESKWNSIYSNDEAKDYKQSQLESFMCPEVRRLKRDCDNKHFGYYYVLENIKSLCFEYKVALDSAELKGVSDNNVLKKHELIDKLLNVIDDNSNPAQGRVDAVKAMMTQASFAKTLQLEMSYDVFSLQWFSHWLQRLWKAVTGYGGSALFKAENLQVKLLKQNGFFSRDNSASDTQEPQQLVHSVGLANSA